MHPTISISSETEIAAENGQLLQPGNDERGTDEAETVRASDVEVEIDDDVQQDLTAISQLVGNKDSANILGDDCLAPRLVTNITERGNSGGSCRNFGSGKCGNWPDDGERSYGEETRRYGCGEFLTA